MTVRIQIHEGNLRRFMESQDGPLMRKTKDIAAAIAVEAAYRAPVVSGNLRRSIKSHPGTESSRYGMSVVAGTSYAKFVTSGTKPHVIMPKKAKMLHFYWPKVGSDVYLPKVNHPGNRPNPFMVDAMTFIMRTRCGA
jgi:hypothetical protein